MIWNRTILKEKKEITLINRILDVIELDTTEVEIQENRIYKNFSYNYNIDLGCSKCCIMEVNYNGVKILFSYVLRLDTSYYYIIDSKTMVGIPIEREEFYQVKEAIEKNIERSILVSLYPFKSPELETVFNDVRKIQDGAEQIEFITNEIKKIKENYAK